MHCCVPLADVTKLFVLDGSLYQTTHLEYFAKSFPVLPALWKPMVTVFLRQPWRPLGDTVDLGCEQSELHRCIGDMKQYSGCRLLRSNSEGAA